MNSKYHQEVFRNNDMTLTEQWNIIFAKSIDYGFLAMMGSKKKKLFPEKFLLLFIWNFWNKLEYSDWD